MGLKDYDLERGQRAERMFEGIYLIIGVFAATALGAVAVDYADGHGDIFKDASIPPEAVHPEHSRNVPAIAVALACASFIGYAFARLKKIG